MRSVGEKDSHIIYSRKDERRQNERLARSAFTLQAQNVDSQLTFCQFYTSIHFHSYQLYASCISRSDRKLTSNAGAAFAQDEIPFHSG